MEDNVTTHRAAISTTYGQCKCLAKTVFYHGVVTENTLILYSFPALKLEQGVVIVAIHNNSLVRGSWRFESRSYKDLQWHTQCGFAQALWMQAVCCFRFLAGSKWPYTQLGCWWVRVMGVCVRHLCVCMCVWSVTFGSAITQQQSDGYCHSCYVYVL